MRYQTIFLIISMVLLVISIVLGGFFIDMYSSEDKPTQEAANIGLASLIFNWVGMITVCVFLFILLVNTATAHPVPLISKE